MLVGGPPGSRLFGDQQRCQGDVLLLGPNASPLVEHQTLDYSLSHDPRVVGSSPASGSVPRVEPA